MLKITFTFGDTVTINLTQNDDGFYIYTPSKYVTSAINFFSIKDAILFFSKFLPTKVYDEDQHFLSFLLTVRYKGKIISFYMSDKDRTKIAWTDYNSGLKGFNDFWSKNRKVDDSIDDVVKHFITFVAWEYKEEEEVNNSITAMNERAYQVKIKDKEYIIDIVKDRMFRVL